MTVHRKIEIVPDAAALARAAAAVFIDTATHAISRSGRFTVALSGGTTPKALYSLLADDPDLRARVPWSDIYFFFSDERHVPPDHADSNYRTANDAMLSKMRIPPDHVFRIPGECADPNQAADLYVGDLRAFFSLQQSQLPRFDLLMLGMGPDGHTASLFPGTDALKEEQRMVVANWIEKFHTHRITLTVPVLNHAARVMFLAHGKDKAPALKDVLEGPPDPMRLPSQLVRPDDGDLVWLVDQTAAALLSRAASRP